MRSLLFFISMLLATSSFAQHITQAEYFFNTDPGFGNATSVPISPGEFVELDFNASTEGLSPGVHMLYVRVKAEYWSQTYARMIGKSAESQITHAEYFFNDDPGFGNGQPVSVTPGQVVEIDFNAITAGLEPGIHTLSVRVKAGFWSQTHTRQVIVSPDTPITQAEYFIGDDPGHGNAIPMNVTPGKLVEIDHVIQNLNLPNGLNYIYFRTFADRWGLTYIHEYCQNPVPDFSTDFAELGNPTSFTNLSQQTDETTEYFWDVNGDGNWDYEGGNNFLHLYDEPGSYMAELMLVSPGNCSTSVVKEVLVYACMAPTDPFADHITYESAELNWTPGNFGSHWEILYGPQGFNPANEGTLIENVTQKPYLLTGLNPETGYAFYVRTVCEDEKSEWAGPAGFTTLEYVCPPDWEPTTNNQFNMQVVGRLYIDGVPTSDPNHVLGAFVEGQCRGMASPNPDLFGLVFLSIGSDVAAGEMVEFVIWNADDCEECSTGESVIFVNQLQIGTPGVPYPYHCGFFELHFDYGAGYTWYSINIDTGSMDLNELFADLDPCEEDRILGQHAFAFYHSGEWIGSLTHNDPSMMYKLQLCESQEIFIEGLPVPNEPITLGAGYTWLGYLPQGPLEINEALANISPAAQEDNRLLGQNNFAVFYQGEWVGGLNYLHPGKGYIIELDHHSTLQYPYASSKTQVSSDERLVSPTGTQPVQNQQYSMMLIARLKMPDGAFSVNPGDVVYAIAGDECRGIAAPMATHDGNIFMSIGSDVGAGENISFKVWLEDKEELFVINENIEFSALKKAGTMENPVILTLEDVTNVPGQPQTSIMIGDPFPNPFNLSTEIPFTLDRPARLELHVYSNQGQLVETVTDTQMSAGRHTATIDGRSLQAGIYHYRMVISMDEKVVQKTGKLIIY